jgi:Fe-S cluster assembly ATP-binding protein
MGDELLKIRGLDVRAEENQILHSISLSIGRGETHVLMGPNGAGKSTLGNVLMGNPQYRVTGGSIEFDGRNLLEQTVDERAKAGLFLSFQNPVEVPGVSLSDFIRSALEMRSGERIRTWEFRKRIRPALEILNMDPSYADRDLNVGFSGGEKKKAEILQLLMLNPSFAILDETDSGLDVDALRIVAEGFNKLRTAETSALVITHYQRLLDYIRPDVVHVLLDGRIVKTGGPELAQEIENRGFDWIKSLTPNPSPNGEGSSRSSSLI